MHHGWRWDTGFGSRGRILFVKVRDVGALVALSVREVIVVLVAFGEILLSALLDLDGIVLKFVPGLLELFGGDSGDVGEVGEGVFGGRNRAGG
jgi:hypothetical protein